MYRRVPAIPTTRIFGWSWPTSFIRYGLKHKQTFRLAQALIDTGVDLKLRESVAEEADLKARARLLQRLKKKWEAPPRRVKKPPSLKPEPFLMSAGEVFSYETMNGNPNHFPAEAGGRRSRRFKPDAVNAFVCFATARVFFDKEARYFIIPLAIFQTDGSGHGRALCQRRGCFAIAISKRGSSRLWAVGCIGRRTT